MNFLLDFDSVDYLKNDIDKTFGNTANKLELDIILAAKKYV
ncbi:MAG: hypothetical protein U9Q66_03365 [Patescibacteria group bacterium]|nr:hypothetical protein [Patescibacteria group bacterium]